MNRFAIISMVLIATILTGCKKDPTTGPEEDDPVNPCISSQFLNGIICINDCPDVDIQKMNEFPEGTSTGNSSFSFLKSGGEEEGSDVILPTHQYRFKLVAQMNNLDIQRDGRTFGTQATHVKITDIVNNVGHAFVTYNYRNEPNIGGIVLYKFTVFPGNLEQADVQVVSVQSIEMKTSQLNAVEYDPVNEPDKLYVCGATDEPGAIGFDNEEARAFFMVLELDPATKKFRKDVAPVIQQLTSFQATSMRKYGNKIYITVGDGKSSPNDNDNDVSTSKGGLYIFDKDGKFVKSILGLKHARSVDVDETGIYLFQANHARIRKYDLDGNFTGLIHDAPNQAMQKDAKSEIMIWKDYLFAAENETGLKMLFKDGMVNESLGPPNATGEFREDGWDKERDVTNSMSMNSDDKIIFLKDEKGVEKTDILKSDLLLVANGEQGLYWYDITNASNKPDDKKDYIAASAYNSILRGTGSANFVTSKGNVVFVANGLGGLKVLYIGQNAGDVPPPVGTGCDKFMGYFYYGENSFSPLFPEGKSVFRNDAHPIIKQLFQWDINGFSNRKAARDITLNYVEIIKDTELFITFLADGAGFYNSLGFFVIPKDVPKTDIDEWNYFNNTIKPDMVKNTTNNYLKPEYTIFKSIAGIDCPHKYDGYMSGGSVYSVGNNRKFKAGERVVFFMCPDGFNAQNNEVVVDFRPRSGSGTSRDPYVDNYKCIFFMHKYFNEKTGVPYSQLYGDFAGQQINTVYSADCKSMVMCFEDIHIKHIYTDVDFNDIIFALSDNMNDREVQNFKAPKWAVEKVSAQELRIFPSNEIFGVVTAFD